MEEAALRDLLRESTRKVGIEIEADKAELLIQHLLLVLEKNKQVNLTAITDDYDGLMLHVVDSLLFVKHISKDDCLVDIGTGGGFPGIPIAIVTEADCLLIDSVGKKVTAVNEFIGKLGIRDHCEARCIRAEELALESRNTFTKVVARAVAPIEILVEYASPLLDIGGQLVISKAVPEEDELIAGNRACELAGLESVSRETIELPEGYGTRTLLCYEKTGESTIKLPRRSGMAKKRPLGSR